MAERKRLFLTGSERAEFEHIHGPLVTDKSDPRFVLVNDEEAAKIFALPAGVPAHRFQAPQDVAAIREQEKGAFAEGKNKGNFDDKAVGGVLNAAPLDVSAEKKESKAK